MSRSNLGVGAFFRELFRTSRLKETRRTTLCREKGSATPSIPRRQVAKALVAAGVEQVVGHGVFDGAVGFVRVRAVGKAAAADVRADVAIEAGDFFGDHVPQLELPDAGRIDDEAAA